MQYFEHRFPIGPRTILPLLEPMVADLRRTHPDDHPDLLELESIVTATKNLPTRLETDPDADPRAPARKGDRQAPHRRAGLEQRRRPRRAGAEPQDHQRRKGEPAQLRPAGGAAGRAGLPPVVLGRRRRGDQLPALLRHQRPGGDPRRRAQGAGGGSREGVRAAARRQDHRPADRPRRRPAGSVALPAAPAAAARRRAALSRRGADQRRIYVVVEKITTGAEELPTDWPIHGTTGYELLNMVNGVFVEPGGFRLIDRSYQRLHEVNGTFDDMLYDAKKLILRTAMSSELYVLARRLDRISEQHRWSRDFTASTLHLALGEVIACFPVYRTYAESDTHEISPNDRMHILRALREAKRRNRSTSESIFDFIGDLLLLRDPEGLTDADRAERRELVLRIQQLTGPVMAKGLEDTVFYRYFPLASLNEVGGRPTTGVVPLDHFHNFCARRRAALAGSAVRQRDPRHEARRGHARAPGRPVRDPARVAGGPAALGAPEPQGQAARRGRAGPRQQRGVLHLPDAGRRLAARGRRRRAGRGRAQDAGRAGERLPDEGAARSQAPHQLGERRRTLREGLPANSCRACSIGAAATTRSWPTCASSWGASRCPGSTTALSQALLKITVPGVPDFYQGTELWDFSLVDPDNRRPVDYAARRALRGRLTEPRRAERDRRGGDRCAAPTGR